MYAARKGLDLARISVDVRYTIAESGTALIRRKITVPASLPSDQRDRLAEIAERAPVTLAVGTPITTTIQPENSERPRDVRRAG
jgi:uncharacterized OsmC-like protein